MDPQMLRQRAAEMKQNAALRAYLERRVTELDHIAGDLERQLIAARTAVAEMRAALGAAQGETPKSGSPG